MMDVYKIFFCILFSNQELVYTIVNELYLICLINSIECKIFERTRRQTDVVLVAVISVFPKSQIFNPGPRVPRSAFWCFSCSNSLTVNYLISWMRFN